MNSNSRHISISLKLNLDGGHGTIRLLLAVIRTTKSTPSRQPHQHQGFPDYTGYGWYRLRLEVPATVLEGNLEIALAPLGLSGRIDVDSRDLRPFSALAGVAPAATSPSTSSAASPPSGPTTRRIRRGVGPLRASFKPASASSSQATKARSYPRTWP